MRALRHLLAGLWAALWLRGRLVGLRLRRVFGGRRTPEAGPDLRLSAETPTEGIDYDPTDLPPELLARLDATRDELLETAREVAQRRNRRFRSGRGRSIAVAVAAFLGLGVVGAGASALVAGSTGVPAVDRLLGIYEAGLSDPKAPPGAVHDLRPAQGTTSVSVEAPLGDSGRKAIGTAYVGRDGGICIARTDALPSDRPVGGLRCVQSEELGARVAEFGGQWSVAIDEKVVLLGVTRGDVTELEGYGPDGPLETKLSEAWDPGLPGVETLKLFLAVDPAGIEAEGQSNAIDRLRDFDRYVMRGKLEDGKNIVIRPIGDAG